MKKWKRILSVMLAVLLLSGSLPVTGGRDGGSRRTGRKQPRVEKKTGTINPKRRPWKI